MNVSACMSSFLEDCFFCNSFNKVSRVPKYTKLLYNVYLLNCLLICAKLVMLYIDVNMVTDFQRFRNYTNKCNKYFQRNGRCYFVFIKTEVFELYCFYFCVLCDYVHCNMFRVLLTIKIKKKTAICPVWTSN